MPLPSGKDHGRRAPASFVSKAARACAALAVALAAVLAWVRAPDARADAPAGDVVLVPIAGTVDLATVPLVERAIARAEREGAAALVLDIDTLGGRLDAAVAIRDRILATRLRTAAFVHPRAISAGALIALSCETLVMQDGATIGAATPVQFGTSSSSARVDEKTISYVRKEFAATAARRARPVLLAEAMVDADVDVPGLVGAGKLLTLTTDEALEHGFADGRANDVAGVLAHVGLASDRANVREATHTWAEHVVRAVTHPIVASLLIAFGMLGLFLEIRTPGLGVPGLVGMLCLALFFGGHSIAHLAGYEEMLLAAVGVVLVTLEVFVFPGFGLSGVLGVLALGASLALSFVGDGAAPGAILASVSQVGIAFLGAMAAFAALFAILPRTTLARGLVLGRALTREAVEGLPDVERSSSGTSTASRSVGRTLTPLRPSGAAWIGGARVDVVSRGEFIPTGARVEVVRREGHRVVVRRAPDAALDPSSRRSESWSV